MELRLTDDEFRYLQEWDYRFHQAVDADYVSMPNPSAIREIHRMWCRIIGRQEILRESCYHCVLRLMKDMGRVYYEEKAERERRAANIKAKEESSPKIVPTTDIKDEEVATVKPTPKKAVKGKKTSNKKK